MKIILYTLLTFALICLCHYHTIVKPTTSHDIQCNSQDIPQEELQTHLIDLDMPPRVRWKEITSKYEGPLTELAQYIHRFLGNEILFLLNPIVKRVASRLPVEYVEEMTGISESLGVSVNEVILLNILNEFISMCTSIVAVDANGKIYHARNLDFGIFMGWNRTSSQWVIPELLKKISIKLVWMKSGTKVAESIGFVGYVGIMTGLRPNSLSITLNDRYSFDGGYIGLIKYILGLSDASFVGYLIREVILSNSSYEEAIKTLSETEIIAPAYLIVGSNFSNGAVITRSRKKSLDIWRINREEGTKYVLQTNYDHWKAPPLYDDRITPGTSCMDQLNESNLTVQGLYGVLRTIPVRNKLTVFTALMVPSEGYLKAYLQDCPSPCNPW